MSHLNTCQNPFCPDAKKVHLLLFPDCHGRPGRVCNTCFVPPENVVEPKKEKKKHKGLKKMLCANVRCTKGTNGRRKHFKQTHPRQKSCCTYCNGQISNQKHADKVRVG